MLAAGEEKIASDMVRLDKVPLEAGEKVFSDKVRRTLSEEPL